MEVQLNEIWENDENLQTHMNGFCKISDILRAPVFDAQQRDDYLFQQVFQFTKENQDYFYRILEQLELAAAPEKDLGDKENE